MQVKKKSLYVWIFMNSGIIMNNMHKYHYSNWIMKLSLHRVQSTFKHGTTNERAHKRIMNKATLDKDYWSQ